jgi:hypothetical protein
LIEVNFLGLERHAPMVEAELSRREAVNLDQ